MNKRGRPPLDPHEASVSISVRVTASVYDELYRQARSERISVGEHIRRALAANAEKDSSSE